MRTYLALVIIVLLVAVSVMANAAVPPMISYQGKLMQPNGTPIPDGTYSIRFAIYDAPTEGNTLWSEVNPSVQVKGGLFATMLGSINNLGPNIFADQNRFFGVKVGDDAEMTPRQQIASSAFAFRAAVAGTVDDGAITTGKLADGAVTAAKVADGGIASTKLAIGIATPAGTISMFGGVAAPTGWLACDGAAISRIAYASLFAAIGTMFGSGDSVTTFNLPDFRGVFPKGTGTTDRAAGKDANGSFYSGTMGAYVQDQMQGHFHDINRPADGKGLTHDGSNGSNNKINLYPTINGSVYGSSGSYVYFGARDMISDGTHGNPRIGVATEPQSLGVSFIIKY